MHPITRRAPTRSAAVAALMAVGLSACVSNLQPAPSAQQVPSLDDAAVTVVDGARVVAQAGEWPGALDIQEEVTPIRVVIENKSRIPLRIRYSEFSLVSPDGHSYAALPPIQIEGDVEVPVGVQSIGEPAFEFSRFRMAPPYQRVYPAIPVYTGPFAYDPYYYDVYDPYWVEIGLPTREMLARALPEGVIDGGGRVDGFLYFEQLPDSVERVTFRAELVNASSGATFGEARIPFVVE